MYTILAFLSCLCFAMAAPTRRGSRLHGCVSTDPRAEAVKEAFLHAYQGYKQYAWGHDELLPKSNGSFNSR